MTHREFLFWLELCFVGATNTGLGSADVAAICDRLTAMSAAGPLQPFASRLHAMLRDHPMLHPRTVADLLSEARLELVPARERTVGFLAVPDEREE